MSASVGSPLTVAGAGVFCTSFIAAMAAGVLWKRSQLAHSLALHLALERAKHTGGMTLWLRGLRGERFSASFSDEVSLLELLADAMEIRGTIRAAQRGVMSQTTARSAQNKRVVPRWPPTKIVVVRTAWLVKLEVILTLYFT